MSIHERMLESGKYFYFRSDEQVYCLAKINNEYELSCWHEDGWVGHIIRKNTALTLMEQESLTHSLQQVQMWIFGMKMVGWAI